MSTACNLFFKNFSKDKKKKEKRKKEKRKKKN
jgi:hypothetical protein